MGSLALLSGCGGTPLNESAALPFHLAIVPVVVQGPRSTETNSESEYLDRRKFLVAAGLGGMSLLGHPLVAGDKEEAREPEKTPAKPSFYPAKRNPLFKVDRPLTSEEDATSYNNFYEFSFNKKGPRLLAQRMRLKPWEVLPVFSAASSRTSVARSTCRTLRSAPGIPVSNTRTWPHWDSMMRPSTTCSTNDDDPGPHRGGGAGPLSDPVGERLRPRAVVSRLFRHPRDPRGGTRQKLGLSEPGAVP